MDVFVHHLGSDQFAMVGNDDVRGAGSLCSIDEDGVAPELILSAQSKNVFVQPVFQQTIQRISEPFMLS